MSQKFSIGFTLSISWRICVYSVTQYREFTDLEKREVGKILRILIDTFDLFEDGGKEKECCHKVTHNFKTNQLNSTHSPVKH